MKFKVYCDESRPDLLSLKKSTAQYMVIDSLWLAAENRVQLKQDIHALRDKHKIGGEFKWQKVSLSRLNFYRDLAELFISRGDQLRFRCIAVVVGNYAVIIRVRGTRADFVTAFVATGRTIGKIKMHPLWTQKNR